ncbi:hypothetical protein [Rhodophyticola porphyridii]|uniref:Uncharacterized protein n=1 Tax=Rhodophyticola porphyridii TaxID=1852017 RepID=A0A3L9YD67_9RHOB|nr:hypothetical protein [Rhodophyticola porphyridii]RMA43966.1 hypothetical protein D9R08_03365 [Rhodophyticola porphyridii]
MMGLDAAPIAILSAAVFCGLVFIRDRPFGALIAQIGSAVAAALVFASLIVDAPMLGRDPAWVSALGVALLAATVAGMGYHLYLGRFTSVWAARGVFAALFLVSAAVLGLVILSFI